MFLGYLVACQLSRLRIGVAASRFIRIERIRE